MESSSEACTFWCEDLLGIKDASQGGLSINKPINYQSMLNNIYTGLVISTFHLWVECVCVSVFVHVQTL